ncbi:MAG: purine-nucleoside phosphorylase [Sphaerochaeta sp.]|jgi:purine-nucleoside phosphorylase
MTPHNSANKNEIAKSVLMPGDPMRAKYIAENFMDDAKLVSSVRGIPCYTGTYKGVPVSTMASGMGCASIGIYSWELFDQYDVDNIIRIGTCGGYDESLEVGDLVLALTASTDTAWAQQYDLKGTFSPVCSPKLLFKVKECATKLGYRHKEGMVLSSDYFSTYYYMGADSWKSWADMGAIAQDMETYALYCNALRAKKNAFSILTMTDSCVTGKCFKDEDRMAGNNKMILTALEAVASGI